MEQITRVQIQESIDTYVKTYITDAEWHISLVEDFMHLLTGNSFNITDLQNSRWIRAIINIMVKQSHVQELMLSSTMERLLKMGIGTIWSNMSKENNRWSVN